MAEEPIFLGHVRLEHEMKALPKGERFWHAYRHGLLPPTTKMHALKMSEGFVVVYPQAHGDVTRQFKTEEEMRLFLEKLGAKLYPVTLPTSAKDSAP